MITDLWTYLKSSKKPIVLYGIGNGADKIINKLESLGINISGAFSSKGFKKNKSFRGIEVTDYENLKEKLGEFIILVCFGSHLENVIEDIKGLSVNNELYAPDVPVCGDQIFDNEFVKKNSHRIKEVYSFLADEQSKKVFENTIYFKLTGKIDYLFEIESSREEVFNLLNLNKSDSFLDLGAFTGDTVEEFVNEVGEYNFITAAEPDKRNFNRLVQNTNSLKNFFPVNAAVSNEEGELSITANHSRGNSKNGKLISVKATTIDFLCEKQKPTLIKMDVEGFEEKAILGGVNTIKFSKPKMHIAAYHTPYDLFEIPILIKSLVPDYKVYMRHHRCIPAWDTNYIFI